MFSENERRPEDRLSFVFLFRYGLRMADLIRRYPRATCWIAFAILFGAFLLAWRWFVFGYRASVTEWVIAMLALFAAGFLIDRRRRR